jgi:hypothetical protein
MENPTVTSFVSAFNPMEKSHVIWLRSMNRTMTKLDPSVRMNLEEIVNENPMGKKMTNAVDWVFIHFGISMAYSKAVLENQAWIPSN